MATIYYIDGNAVQAMTGKSAMINGWDDSVSDKLVTSYLKEHHTPKRGDVACYEFNGTVDFVPDTIYIYDGEMFKQLSFCKARGEFVIPDEFRDDNFPSNYWCLRGSDALDYAWKFDFEELEEPTFELRLEPIRQQLLSNLREVAINEEDSMTITHFVSDKITYTLTGSLQYTMAEIRQIIEDDAYMNITYVPWYDVQKDVDIRMFEMTV